MWLFKLTFFITARLLLQGQYRLAVAARRLAQVLVELRA
jgi:hypothetical protein